MMKLTTNYPHFGYFALISFVIVAWVYLAVLFLKGNHSILSRNDQFNLSKSDSKIDFEENNKILHGRNFIDDFVEPSSSTQKINRFKYHIPKFMLELYENNKIRGGNNNTRPDIVRSVIPTHAGHTDINEILGEISDNHLLIFNLPTSGKEEQFVSAELKILTLVEVNSNAINGVERQLKISVYDDVTKKFSHTEKIHVYHLNNTWLSFNLTQPVTKILQKSEENRFLKIVITISDFLPYYQDSTNFKLSLMPISDDLEHDYPILLLSYYSSSINMKLHDQNSNVAAKMVRKKRNIEEDYEEESNNVWDDEIIKKIPLKKIKKTKNGCRRRPLYVNFAEIEYDQWIVQPPGYEAYQCQGRCFYPVAEHLNPTKHAIVQALLHSVAPSKATRSCCVPTLLDSISILYIDGKGVLTYRYAYKDMVVVECGCR